MAPKAMRAKAGQTDVELKAAEHLDTASDFTSPSLSVLESSLRCPICSEFFTAPVILTNCSHSFDSRCLRDYLAVHKRCPSCLAETDESRIRKNLALQEVLNAWQSARWVSRARDARAHELTHLNVQGRDPPTRRCRLIRFDPHRRPITPVSSLSHSTISSPHPHIRQLYRSRIERQAQSRLFALRQARTRLRRRHYRNRRQLRYRDRRGRVKQCDEAAKEAGERGEWTGEGGCGPDRSCASFPACSRPQLTFSFQQT